MRAGGMPCWRAWRQAASAWWALGAPGAPRALGALSAPGSLLTTRVHHDGPWPRRGCGVHARAPVLLVLATAPGLALGLALE
jgi:hypothetical protein